ncbi:ABC transporter permease [candidate division KSB1 bacterium]|nr:MAG: ABC transporter permease [candidate division KSB1 bacterium]
MERKNAQIIFTLGTKALDFFSHIFEITCLLLQVLRNLPRIYFYRRQVIEQFYSVGVASIPLVVMMGIFTGLVTAVQSAYQFEPTTPQYLVGSVILQTVVIELGPVLIALILSGRIGAGTAAEIGSMKVSGQILALESLALDPVGFLVMPRILAGVIMFPILVIITDFLAIGSGMLLTTTKMSVTSYDFIRGMRLVFSLHDIAVGLIKAAFFGFIVTLLGSYFGLNARGGAKGVGFNTTLSVISASSMILVLDYVVAEIFL